MKDDSPFTHVLYHDDLSGLVDRPMPIQSAFKVVSRGLGKYLEPVVPYTSLYRIGAEAWREIRFRAVVTPLSFDDIAPTGGFCGIFSNYRNENDYVALVLAHDFHLKLMRKTPAGFELLAHCPVDFCLGQSLSLTLTTTGGRIAGSAAPYSGTVTIEAQDSSLRGGRAGFVCAAQARLGPHTVECSEEEVLRLRQLEERSRTAIEKKRSAFPQMKRALSVPLHRLATGGNLQFADLDRDGRLEILAAQSSEKVADRLSLTNMTCLTALDMTGKILWQAGVPCEKGDIFPPAGYGDLPFRAHDLFGDGRLVAVCVFGYDVQIRDAKTGRVLMSAQTPSTRPLSDEFKNMWEVGPWGDETLNMLVRHISFCDTQGNGGKKEIVVSDGRCNLAVLDPLAEPLLHPIFQFSGNVDGPPWSGDLDGDGKDEIIAGGSVLDNDGRKLATLRDVGLVSSVPVVLDPLENGTAKNIYMCLDTGLYSFAATRIPGTSKMHFAPGRLRTVSAGNITAAKFRADLPGLQFAMKSYRSSDAFQISILDNSLNALVTREFSGSGSSGFEAVNWTGKPESLLLCCVEKGFGLMDGYGDIVVAFPDDNEYGYCDVIKGYCPNGRDAIAAWNSVELSIYVPE